MPAHVLSIDNCNRWAGVNGALTSECPSRRDRYPFGQRYSLSTGFIFSFHSFRFGRKKSIIAYLTTAGLSVVAISFIPAGTENTGNEETISALIMATYRGEGVAKSINKKSKKKYVHRRWGGEHVKRWGMLVVSLRTVNHGFGLTQLTFFGVKLLTTQENYLKEQNSKLFERCLAFYASTFQACRGCTKFIRNVKKNVEIYCRFCYKHYALNLYYDMKVSWQRFPYCFSFSLHCWSSHAWYAG